MYTSWIEWKKHTLHGLSEKKHTLHGLSEKKTHFIDWVKKNTYFMDLVKKNTHFMDWVKKNTYFMDWVKKTHTSWIEWKKKNILHGRSEKNTHFMDWVKENNLEITTSVQKIAKWKLCPSSSFCLRFCENSAWNNSQLPTEAFLHEVRRTLVAKRNANCKMQNVNAKYF